MAERILWIASVALQAALAIRLLWGHGASRLPFFTAFLMASLSRSVLLFLVARNSASYFYIFAGGEIVLTALLSVSGGEVLCHLKRRYGPFREIWTYLIVTTLLVTAAALFLVSGFHLHPSWAGAMQLAVAGKKWGWALIGAALLVAHAVLRFLPEGMHPEWMVRHHRILMAYTVFGSSSAVLYSSAGQALKSEINLAFLFLSCVFHGCWIMALSASAMKMEYEVDSIRPSETPDEMLRALRTAFRRVRLGLDRRADAARREQTP